MTMRGIFTVVPLVFACVTVPGLTAANQAGGSTTATTHPVSAPAKAPAGGGRVDAARLPVSVDRITRQLKSGRDMEVFSGASLEYHLSVYAMAPAIRVFLPGENQTTGPVRDSAPAHHDFIDFWSGWKRGRR